VAQQFSVAGPGIAGPLAPSIKPAPVYSSHLITEPLQTVVVADHSIVIVITTKFGVQQLELFSEATMALLLTPFVNAFD
jgi:hypothetical protein